MLRRYISQLKQFDWILFASVFLLICFGLAELYSIAISFDVPDFFNFKRQLLFAAVGLVLMFGLSLMNYRILQDYAPFFYGVGLVLLVGVLFFGQTLRGTTGWFSVFGFSFQPVELAKITLIIALSWLISKGYFDLKKFKNFLITSSVFLVYFTLVILQPDFGSGVMLFLIWLAMIIFGGASKKQLVILGLLFLALFAFAWVFLFQEYQQDRILAFLDPQTDPYGRGYQVRQAVTAVGAGGIYGRGLGFGSQSQLKFLPASQTDFIFAVIAEELGFLGVTLVLFFWGLIFYRLTRAAKLTNDIFAMYFILGTSSLFFVQIMINIGMNIGIVPVTGISLPFLSYGGSFLLTSMVLMGIVQSAIIRSTKA